MEEECLCDLDFTCEVHRDEWDAWADYFHLPPIVHDLEWAYEPEDIKHPARLRDLFS